MPLSKESRYCMMKLGVKKGNFFDHLDKDEIELLTVEASHMKTDIGVVVASIVKDAYYEEKVSDILDIKSLNHLKN